MVNRRNLHVHRDRDVGGRAGSGTRSRSRKTSSAEVVDEQEGGLLDARRLPLAALDNDDRRVEVLLLLAERHLQQGVIFGLDLEPVRWNLSILIG